MNYQFKTNDGIQVICIPGWYTNSTLIQWFVKAGSINDPVGRTGLAHFVEHMMFKGTTVHKTAQSISLELNKFGTYFNANTTLQRTCYEVHIDSNEWKRGLQILTEIMYKSTIPENEIKSEIDVGINEIARLDGGAIQILHKNADAWIWSGTQYAHSVGGLVADIRAITQIDVLEFIGNYYRPDRMVIIITGDILAEKQGTREIKRILNHGWKETHLEKAKKIATSAGKIHPLLHYGVPDWWASFFGKSYSKNNPYIFEKRRCENSLIVVGGTIEHPDYPGPSIQWIPHDSAHVYIRIDFPVKDADKHNIYNICNWMTCYFSEGMGSILFQKLREERGLVYSIKTMIDNNYPAGIFSFITSCEPKHILTVIQIIMSEISILTSKKLSKKQVEFYTTMLEGIHKIHHDTPTNRAEYVAYHFFTHNEILTTNNNNRDLSTEVTSENIQQLANDVFRSDICWISCVGPKPTRKNLENIIKKTKNQLIAKK